MILKKFLERGQAVFEYFLIFAGIITFTFLSVSTFFPKIRDAVQGTDATGAPGYAQKAFTAIINADTRW
jgi:hypothetical protein